MITVGELCKYVEDMRLDIEDFDDWDLHGLLVSFTDEISDDDIEIEIKTNECRECMSCEYNNDKEAA